MKRTEESAIPFEYFFSVLPSPSTFSVWEYMRSDAVSRCEWFLIYYIKKKWHISHFLTDIDYEIHMTFFIYLF